MDVTFVLPLGLAQAENICRWAMEAAQIKYVMFGNKRFVCLANGKSPTMSTVVEITLQLIGINQTEVMIREEIDDSKLSRQCISQLQELRYLRTCMETLALNQALFEQNMPRGVGNSLARPTMH